MTTPANKVEALNLLIQAGYSIPFILDQLVQDRLTHEEMTAFYEDTIDRYPNPLDTTGTYVTYMPKSVRPMERPCTTLRLISKRS